jgi:hypothetical protein
MPIDFSDTVPPICRIVAHSWYDFFRNAAGRRCRIVPVNEMVGNDSGSRTGPSPRRPRQLGEKPAGPPAPTYGAGAMDPPVTPPKSVSHCENQEPSGARFVCRKDRPLVLPQTAVVSAVCRAPRMSGRVRSRLVGAGLRPLRSSSSGLGRGWQSRAAMAISTADCTGFLGCAFLSIVSSVRGRTGAGIQGCHPGLIAPGRNLSGLPRPWCGFMRPRFPRVACQA